MRRFMAWLIAMLFVLNTLPFGAVAEGQSDVTEGFRVLQTRDFPMINASLTLFEHEKTGAKLMYVANDDVNRVFQLNFLTRPIDNTGLPHVFEHATLDGSEKYPSKTLFFNLIYQTYNTYLNASTSSLYTSYPMASLSEEQLLKYADFYVDSCLHPMLMEDESIFREEAWRYRMAGMDDELTIEGTVYTEMMGATNLARAARMNLYRAAFPGSVIGFDQGGDPDVIPEMTYESLKAYHDLFYHPSNCMAFLYGKFNDYTAFLKLLNEAFADYEKTEFHFEDADYVPLTEPVQVSVAYPTEKGSSTENISVVYYAFVCPGAKEDTHELLLLDTLTTLMGMEGSPLMQALKKAMPSGDFYVYTDLTSPDPAIVFEADQMNPDQAELFKSVVDSSLAELGASGFSQELVESTMANVEISSRLVSEDTNSGINLMNTVAFYYAMTGEPFGYCDYIDSLSMMDTWNQEGKYKEIIGKWLQPGAPTALVTTYPDPSAKEIKEEALKATLAEIKDGMTEEEKQAIIDRTNAQEAEEDNTALLEKLQAVSVQSLPEEIREYELNDTVDEMGVRHLDAAAGVDGIGEPVILLDAKGLEQNEIHYFSLMTDLLGKLDTDRHTKEELELLSSRYLYDRDMRLALIKDEQEGYVPYLHLSWTAMDDDLQKGYDLIEEIVYHTQFTDPQKVLEQVTAAKSSLRTLISNQGYNVLLYRAAAASDGRYRYYNYFYFIDYYLFLQTVEQQLAEDPSAVLNALQTVQKKLHNSYGAISIFAGSQESAELNRKCLDGFMSSLDHEAFEHKTYDLPVPAAHEGLILDTNIQFNNQFIDYGTLGMEFDAGQRAMINLVSDTFLIPLLRDQYGVYTPLSGAQKDLGIYLLTYRDPNIAQTFEVYDSLAELVENLEVDQKTLDGYILSAYAGYAASTGELSGALNAATYVLNGEDQRVVLDYMRELKAVTPEKIRESAAIFKAGAEKGIRSTAGSASMINANAERYDVILNPFNAVDTSAVVFQDAQEGSAHYDAVRFVFENGFMAPLKEDVFGTDEPATAGELAAALYALVGMGNDANAAMELFSSYGMIPEDVAVDTVLTNGMADTMIAGFGSLVGLSITAEEDETSGLVQTRGELAENLFRLYSFIYAQ